MDHYKLTIVIVSHGSRRPQSCLEFQSFFDQLSAHLKQTNPQVRLLHGFIEIQNPSVEETLNIACQFEDPIHVIPLSLFSATHVKKDIPRFIANTLRRHPNAQITSDEAIGPHPFMAELCRRRLQPFLKNTSSKDTALVLVGRGSNDPEANRDFMKLSCMISDKTGIETIIHCFSGITKPDIPAGLLEAAYLRHPNIIIMPYLLFTGVLLERLIKNQEDFAASHPHIHVERANHLGADNSLHSYILSSIDSFINEAQKSHQSFLGTDLFPDPCL